MLFNSSDYVLFLGIVFFLFWGARNHVWLRTVVLLVSSYLFYMSWNALFILLILGSTVLDYFIALGIARAGAPRKKKLLLLVSLVGNLGTLCLFKYYDFALGSLASVLGLPQLLDGQLHWLLPVGISFYTFQTLSYTLDVYRGELQPTTSFLRFATFVAFFPQLVAGPIVRAAEFLPQFESPPSLDRSQVGSGFFLILRGMVKKVLVADFLAGRWIDRVWDDPGAYSSSEVWFAVFAYTWQLYGDFSGYTDIARGSARLLGFELPINFRRPFQATGPIDFWSRWHLTLSSWIRDYVYVPLGGSKKGRARSYVNLFITFLLAGIWHGAGWTFVIFGVWHGAAVAGNRMFRDWARSHESLWISQAYRAVPRRVWTALNLTLFVLHWPVFRSPDLDTMMRMYRQMFSFSGTAMRVDPWTWAVTLAFTVVHLTPQGWVDRVAQWYRDSSDIARAGFTIAMAAILVWVGRGQATPFIYFQF